MRKYEILRRFLASKWMQASVLLGFVVLTYLPVLLEAGWIWDDDDYVTHNATLRTFAGLIDIWLEPQATPQYYPIVHTTFWLEFRFWGLNPFGYHLSNVVLHGLTALILWRCLRVLGMPGAWFAAALFAAHPVQVESVAWVTERKNVLSGFFAILATYLYLRFVDSGLSPKAEKSARSRQLLLGAAVAFLIGLLSKTVIATLPCTLFLLLIWKYGWQTAHSHFFVLGGFLIVGVAFGLWTAVLEAEHVGASGSEFEWSLAQRFWIAGNALWFYLFKLMVPLHLTFIYPRWDIENIAWYEWLLPAAAWLLPIILFKLRRLVGQGPLIAVLIYGGTLFPALGFLNVYPMRYSFVADHFQYHASMAMLCLIAGGAHYLVRRREGRLIGGGICLLLCMTLSLSQGRMYANEKKLWEVTVERNPQAWIAHHNLGVAARKDGDLDKAKEHLDHALSLYREPKLLTSAGMLHFDLAKRADFDLDHLRQAESFIAEALELWPDLHLANMAMGHILLVSPEKELDQVIRYYEKALDEFPSEQDFVHQGMLAARQNLPMVYRDRGLERAQQQRTQAALEDFSTAAALNPGLLDVRLYELWIKVAHAKMEFRDISHVHRELDEVRSRAGENNPWFLDLQAAAHAGIEEYEEAILLAEQALQLAKRMGSDSLSSSVARRLSLYRRKQPYLSATGLPD